MSKSVTEFTEEKKTALAAPVGSMRVVGPAAFVYGLHCECGVPFHVEKHKTICLNKDCKHFSVRFATTRIELQKL